MIYLQTAPMANEHQDLLHRIPSSNQLQPTPTQRAMQGEYRKKIQNYSFLLTDRIGKGYSSTVYRGLDDLTGEQVAIKVIQLRSLRDETSKLMLQTEIECFRQVQHPNILKYINSFFTVNNCYIITEYCPGGDLSKIMKKKGKIPEDQAAQLFIQIFQGYKSFHQSGFVHRDLKPANILIGKENQLKLADFGFSKKQTLVDRQNYNVGTPIYMPRESLAANIYNERTDTWALGITLYQMIYGEVPFRGRSEQQLRANIEKGRINFPIVVPASQQLKDFISQSLLNDSLKRMGVKQMEKHPWMLKYTSKDRVILFDSPEKVQQQNILRTSLPNDAILQNKSREYFDGKQNRRSVSTMQKLKLCMPKKGSQVIKAGEPSRDRILTENTKQNIKCSDIFDKQNHQQNYQKNKTERNIRAQSKQKKEVKSNGIEKVVTLINYFRFLYKLLEKIREVKLQYYSQSVKKKLDALERELTSKISSIMIKHLTSIADKSNQFNLNYYDWVNFATSERWKMYQFVISRYQTKYSHILNESQSQKNDASALFSILYLFKDDLLNGELQKIMLRQRYLLLELLIMVHHLFKMDKVISKEGWESFSVQFTNSEAVILQPPKINIQNYEEFEHELKADCLTFQQQTY